MQPRDVFSPEGNRNGDAALRAERFEAVRKFSGTTALIQAVPDLEAQRLSAHVQRALTRSGWTVQEVSGIPVGRIDDGVTIISIEDALFNLGGPITAGSPVSDAGRAAQAAVALLELDLGHPYGPPMRGVLWKPTPSWMVENLYGNFVIPDRTALILVEMKPVRWTFVWAVAPAIASE
jgi:hypothetical protein